MDLKPHTSSSGEIGALGLGDTGAEECGKRRLGHWGLEGHRFDRSRTAGRTSLLECRGAHQEELEIKAQRESYEEGQKLKHTHKKTNLSCFVCKYCQCVNVSYLVCVGHLHGSNGVACIHRALECVFINHGQDIRQRRAVQNGSSTGHEVLSVVGRGSQNVGVLLGNLGNDSGHIFGQGVNKSVVLNHQHLSHTRYAGSILGNSIEALAKDKDGDLEN